MPDPLPPPPWLKEEEGEKTLLDELVGQTVVDTGSRTQGVLKTRTDRRTGQRVYWLSGEGGRAFNLGTSPTLMNPSTFQLYTLTPAGTVMSGGKASQFQLEQFGLLETGGAGGGGGAAAPQWRPGELDLERQRLQADIAATEQRLEEIRMQEAAADERQRLQLQAEREMLEMRLENDRRTLVYSEYGATKRTLIQEKGEARRMAFQTREDPFAFAQALTPGPMLGGTPAQTFRGNALAFANAPIPQMSMDMPIPQMEQILGGMGGLQMPMPGPYVGMAGGGTIEMEKGEDDIFRTRPHKMSWLVGEGKHGEGLAMGTAEVLTVGDGKVEVTPLAGGAQAGMTAPYPMPSPWSPPSAPMAPYPAPWTPTGTMAPWTMPSAAAASSSGGVNPEAMKALLGPLFADISPGGFPLAAAPQRASWLGRFGYQPSLVRVGDDYYLRSPEGSYRAISPYYITGAGAGPMTPTPESAVSLRAGELSRLGSIGSPLPGGAGLVDFLKSLQRPQTPSAFGPMSALLSEPVTGAMMPAPYQVAQELTRLRYENPTLFEGILSAYANAQIGGQPAGFTRQAVMGQMTAATPQARYAGYQPSRIGWTGGQY